MKLEFDPKALGKTEIGWWMAHNEGNKEKLFELLIKQHTILYGLSPDDARSALLPLVEAVGYHDTRDWQSAVKSATSYYEILKEKTGLAFDPPQAGQLEVGWWRLHDELTGNPDKSALADYFANFYGYLFGVPGEKLKDAGVARALATLEHDLAEDPESSPSKANFHWEQAERFLVEFYEELKKSSETKRAPTDG